MWRCSSVLRCVRRTSWRLASAVAEQGATAQLPSSSEAASVRAFYSALTYDEQLGTIEVPDMTVELLPFQKNGVAWMAQREMGHVGGIMADHLGMGKTVQMIGLCLVSDRVNKLSGARQMRRRLRLAEGYRLLTVIRQMLKISVVANCSRINRPAEPLQALMTRLNERMAAGSGAGYEDIRGELDRWLAFAAKFHPSYERRATSFLDDEQKRDFDAIESKELRTLVVVPAALMLQWKSEIESKVRAARGMRVYLYHGESRWISSTELELYDFVITTYDTLSNSALEAFIPGDDARSYAFCRAQAGPLFRVRWKRVILDEAHMIRHARTQRWRAVQELEGTHRWAVTATPLHNSIDDLQNLLHFVGLPRLPVLPGSSADELLHDPLLQRSIARSLQPAFLRRGPVMVHNGRREVLVQLPAKHEQVVRRPFSVAESHMYNDILARSRSALATPGHKEGAFHIFAMMTRLRQTCCHPWISQGRAVRVSFCGICNGEASAVVETRCDHTFCHECLLHRFNEAGDGERVALNIACPTCGSVVMFKQVFKRSMPTSAERLAQYRARELQVSTKLKMVLDAYHEMRRNHAEDKMIVFSHFTSFLDVITVAFEHYKIDCLRLDGTMSLSLRNTTINHFQRNEAIKVILASKTATGVGLNLTSANHVLIVDPWWNPAIEEQAVHRCYRIGQKKPVYVTRFIITDTIEQYCYEICQRKKEFGDAVLRAATAGDASAKVAASKLQELIGHLKFVEQGRATTAVQKDTTSADESSGASNSSFEQEVTNVTL